MSFRSAEGSKYIDVVESFVKYPTAQGEVAFPAGITCGVTTVENTGINTPLLDVGDIVSTNDIQVGNELVFPDASIQTTAFTDILPSPAGTYTNANITVDSKGRVTTASNGSIVDTHYIYTSNSGNNNWTFNLNEASNDGYTGTAIQFGKCYDWYIYTNTGSGPNKETGFFSNGGGASVNDHPAPSDFGKEQTDNTGVIVVQNVTNNFICSGVGYFVPTNENQTVLTFWQGFEEQITFNQFLYSYFHQITGAPVGNSLTFTDRLVNMTINTPTTAPPFISSNGKNQLNIVADDDTLFETTLTMVIIPRPMPPMP
jgi:hypothetical protein